MKEVWGRGSFMNGVGMLENGSFFERGKFYEWSWNVGSWRVGSYESYESYGINAVCGECLGGRSWLYKGRGESLKANFPWMDCWKECG